jgi:hypothetical protein
MTSNNGSKPPDFECVFVAYQPILKPQGGNKGGGYKLELTLSESEWDAVKDINNPVLQGMVLTVGIVGKMVK